VLGTLQPVFGRGDALQFKVRSNLLIARPILGPNNDYNTGTILCAMIFRRRAIGLAFNVQIL
jgi:hypothetical protein